MKTNIDLLQNHLESQLYHETALHYLRDQGLLDLFKGQTGAVSGVALGLFSEMTKLETVVHEYVGHGLLGYRLLFNFEKGEGPIYQADAIDNIKNIFKSKSFGNFFGNVWRFLIGFDANKDGRGGWTSNDTFRLNSIGKALGFTQSNAWVSFAGSVPTLAITSSAVATGVRASENYPALGSFLLGFGLTQHFLSCTYPWGGVKMSAEEILKQASNGHDFANVAHLMSQVTGLSAHTVSILTAVSYTLFVPAVALAVWVLRQGSRDHLVTDLEAAVYGLKNQKLDDEVKRLVKQFGELNNKFPDYFMSYVSSSKLKECRASLLKDLKTNKENNWKERIIELTAVANMTGLVAVRIIQLLGHTMVPALKSTGHALKYVSPLFGLVSILPSSYEFYRDLISKNPKLAKFYSSVQLIGSVATAAGIVVGQMVPGAFLIGVGVMTLGIAATLVFGALKARVIRHRVAMELCLLDKVFDSMVKKITTGDKEKNSRLFWRWISLVHQAKAQGLVKDEQLKVLESIHFDQYKSYNRLTIIIEQMKQIYVRRMQVAPAV